LAIAHGSAAERKRSWYLLNILAAMSILWLTVVLGAQVYFFNTDRIAKITVSDTLWVPFAWAMSLCTFALFWLWIRMLVDFFRERPSRHPVAWGWALFLGMYLGGIAYFFAVWRPRNKQQRAQQWIR
jgi:hypothetical protein